MKQRPSGRWLARFSGARQGALGLPPVAIYQTDDIASCGVETSTMRRSSIAVTRCNVPAR